MAGAFLASGFLIDNGLHRINMVTKMSWYKGFFAASSLLIILCGQLLLLTAGSLSVSAYGGCLSGSQQVLRFGPQRMRLR